MAAGLLSTVESWTGSWGRFQDVQDRDKAFGSTACRGRVVLRSPWSRRCTPGSRHGAPRDLVELHVHGEGKDV
jgi:hypothetical protein